MSQSVANGRQTVGEILVGMIDIPPSDLRRAERKAETAGTRLEQALLDLRLATESHVALATAQYLNLPTIKLANFSPDPELVRQIPGKTLRDLQVFPVAQWSDMFVMAVADPFDVTAVDELERVTGCPVTPYVALPQEIAQLLDKHASRPSERMGEVIRDVSEVDASIETDLAGEDALTQDDMHGMAEQAPVIRVVNSMLLEALRNGVSDIHIEPTQDRLHIRFRIDGVLYDEPSPPLNMKWAIVSRVKIIASLDIAERRLPQDGRFTVHAFGRDVDIRVSLIPTVHGQKTVLRILDKINLRPNLAALDLEKDDWEKFERGIRRPSGLILVTGPTGSGKTTTLYSVLQELNDSRVNIITVEDPVEYQLPRINQVHTNPEIGLTFAAGLRSILRQDPDIIMVGEIRDYETASIAVESSLTGHLVLSTLHTNDAPGAVSRLAHMGIEPFLLASSLRLAQAQRIHRKLCQACRKPQRLTHGLLAKHDIDPALLEGGKVFMPGGCALCSQIGYWGRDAIMEILEVNEEIRGMILARKSGAELRSRAVAGGMRTMREAGLVKVARGITSIEEILRVTNEG